MLRRKYPGGTKPMNLEITQSDGFTDNGASYFGYVADSVAADAFSFDDTELDSGVSKVIRKIREDYSRPHTVSSLARECGMSVRSLHRLYRAATGNTVGKDLLARRIEVAAEMLREDDLKLEPVAMETGLRNAKNLCRLFKEHLGLTPGQWKESFHGSCIRNS